ncbi:hypothetical protein PM035_06985 [Halorubrum ezzemoulense]|uniref:hypothetical protein n=1 Tax=Halorubrum ezzemoulense TaxID=337243 RepID=UPI00232E3411|nr:hypothetical protein [Halorubrum ezzemoulense]MDB2260978.1 hypothetical protein [Halorubrum ezzemoulense]MDB2267446.1 hypothetical protein [Halorubrum ezzemoulense]
MSTDLSLNPSDHKTEPDLRWQACFEAAIEYFADHVDYNISAHAKGGDFSDQPSTAREYFNGRGWTDETIREYRLGWAPVEGRGSLQGHLKQRGYSEEEILATGLFDINMDPLWKGRYVLPYLNDRGEPVFAISRETENNSHPEDYFNKYAKAATSKEYSHISEPIFGLGTIREGEPVVITEGIADAITVQQSGYPCISPVTTSFKKSDRPKLLAKLIDQSVSRVYVIQDSELPGIEYDENRGKIETSQYSPGIRGAVKTAKFLTENGVEARVNTPPQIGSDKIDVHDFLYEGWGTLETLIRSAKPPDHFDSFSTSTMREPRESKETRSPISSDSENQSALFSLDLCDVTGQSVGYRGTNPLGHTGDSEDYYKIYSREWSFDHKRGVGYNPLFFLLCEAGERRIEEPYGALSNKEKFVAWKHAKENGLVSEEDLIPHFGLVYVALDSKLCVKEEIDDGWKIPPEAYNQALETVQEEYGLDPGREPLGSETATASVPRSPNLLDSEEEIESELTLKEARSRCEQTIDQALAHDSQYDLIDALPALGKSYGVVKWAANNGTPLTVLTPRRDLHEQNKGWCKEFGLNFYTLPAFHRNCGCMAGDHGSEWKDRVQSLYNAGVSGRQIHEMARYQFGEELPCMRNGSCAYLSQLGFDPEDYDVLLGNYLHAHMEYVVDTVS